jgi:hypothetical protein
MTQTEALKMSFGFDSGEYRVFLRVWGTYDKFNSIEDGCLSRFGLISLEDNAVRRTSQCFSDNATRAANNFMRSGYDSVAEATRIYEAHQTGKGKRKSTSGGGRSHTDGPNAFGNIGGRDNCDACASIRVPNFESTNVTSWIASTRASTTRRLVV